MTRVSDNKSGMCGWENGKCVTDDAAPAKDWHPAGATSPPEAPDGATYVSSTLPAESLPEGQPHRVTNPRARIALAQSVLSHRPATFETIALAIRALEGEDLIATGAK